MQRADGVRSLLEAATLVRDEADLERALEQIARYIAGTLGFEVVVTNLYRRAWDDYVVTSVHGDEGARERLLGCSYERSFLEAPLVAEFDHNGAFLIPEGAYDWDELGGDRFVPDVEAAADDTSWHAGDELFVPFRSFAGELLGIYCVGQPESGRRPSPDELDALVAAVEHAAVAVEAAQAAAEAGRQRRALEHLLRVSAVLTSTSVDEAPLQLVVDGIHDALGFLKVAVYGVVDGALVPSAFAGWTAESVAVDHVFPVDEFRSLFQPPFELAGCYLVPDDIACAIVPQTHQIYESEMNGRGRHGWQGDWLLVPLYGREGELLGVIWADDPADRLRPDEETLKILRMFANHAAAAIEASRDVAALRELVERLRELDTMKDDFVALVSHELRTPLTSIQGYTELLRDDVADPQQRSFLDVIERSTERLLSVVNDLLLVAQLQAGKVELRLDDVVLADVLREAAAGGRVAAGEKDVSVDVDADPELVVHGDRARLGQVVDNLVSNAIKFTPAGGRVELCCRRDGETAVVEVTDTGIGIPQAEQKKMFTRFFRTSNARDAHIPGTGLGLAITQAIVETHGGTIGFTSDEGAGTTFRLELQLAGRLAPA